MWFNFLFSQKSRESRFHVYKQSILSLFVDDSYLQGAIKELCLQNVEAMVKLLQFLGFTIHAKKSLLDQTQYKVFLRFNIHYRLNYCISKN